MTIVIRPAKHPAILDKLNFSLAELEVAQGNYGEVRAMMGLNYKTDDNPYEVYNEEKFAELAEGVYNVDIPLVYKFPDRDHTYKLEGYRAKLLIVIAFCIGKQCGIYMD